MITLTLTPTVPRPRAAVAAEAIEVDQLRAVYDWALVRRTQAGDTAAFGELYQSTYNQIYRYAYYRVRGDRVVAEDLVAEAYLRAWRRIDTLTTQVSTPAAWLTVIVRNILLDQLKSSRYQREISTADMRDMDRAVPGPEDAVVAHRTRRVFLRAALQTLTDEQRECLLYRFVEGLSVTETAQAMGREVGAVKALQHRAIVRLRAAAVLAGMGVS